MALSPESLLQAEKLRLINFIDQAEEKNALEGKSKERDIKINDVRNSLMSYDRAIEVLKKYY